MKNVRTETEIKNEEEINELSDSLRRVYSSYQDFFNRVAFDIRCKILS